MVLSDSTDEGLILVMDKNELAACDGNPQAFVMKLSEKGLFKPAVSSPM